MAEQNGKPVQFQDVYLYTHQKIYYYYYFEGLFLWFSLDDVFLPLPIFLLVEKMGKLEGNHFHQ